MVALDFPANPFDGQVYEQFFWDATAGIWRNRQIVAKLDNLADVNAPSPAVNNKLKWNGTAWIPGSDDLNSLTNVNAPAAANGQKLRFNGTAWVPVTDDLNSLTNVSAASPTINSKLKWNGTSWVPVEDTLNSLNNVSAASPVTNSKLRWNGSNWVAVLDDLNSLTNVSLPSLSSANANNLLQFNGTNWVNVSGISAASISSGTLPLVRGGTGGTTRPSARNGIGVFVQSGEPTSAQRQTGDLWFW